MITLREVLARTQAFFQSRGIESARLDAELLLSHQLGIDRLHLYFNLDKPMLEPELAALRPLVARRGAREPLAWILLSKGFHALDLYAPPGVLVPRPDTETLVEAALELIPEGDEPVYVADVGCGTGAVGLAIAAARPQVRLYCTDISQHALDATRENVRRLGFEARVAVLAGDLLSPVPAHRPLTWVVSNPPYIPSADIYELAPEVSRHEPRLALDGGADGLRVYERLIPTAVARAERGVLLEVGAGQAADVSEILRRSGLSTPRRWSDFGGIERVVGGLK